MTVQYHSPIGWLEIIGTDEGIQAIRFVEQPGQDAAAIPACLITCVAQLDEYFRGTRREFAVPLVLRGTPFQQCVWQQVAHIPFGATQSYGAIAAAIGQPQASRAVGSANHRNPLPIIIPCHRVVGSHGKLVGYGGGLWRKEWLLAHEKTHQRQRCEDATAAEGQTRFLNF